MWSKIVLAVITLLSAIIGKRDSVKSKAEAKMISYQADSIFMDNYERIIHLLEKRIANDTLIIEKLEVANQQQKEEIQVLKEENRLLNNEIIILKAKIKKQDNG